MDIILLKKTLDKYIEVMRKERRLKNGFIRVTEAQFEALRQDWQSRHPGQTFPSTYRAIRLVIYHDSYW